MKTSLRKTVAAVLLLVLFHAAAAQAHVVVYPREVPANSYQVFTVRVPSENPDDYTVKVEVRIPEGVNISRIEPKPGWTHELVTDENGAVTGVVWTAEGQGLAVTEFSEFRMQGRVGDEAEQLVWRAYQTYGSGEVAEWIGAPDADFPASVTTVIHDAADDGHAGHTGDAANGDKTDDLSRLAFSLSIAALLLSVIALFLVVLKQWGNRN